MNRTSLRRVMTASLTGLVLAVAAISTPIVMAELAPAQAQVSAEFQAALDAYGHWVRHPRWGDVWVPDDRPAGWRPYTDGHWVYTDEWGWYWVSDEAEEDWGWITYHYGRWAFDRQLGWFWVPGSEWAPAWVGWRRGNDYVGWAPLPPDEVIVEYDDNPSYWTFVAPRYMLAPNPRRYFLPPQRTATILRNTAVINRTIVMQHGNNARARFAVNAGVSPAIVAAARHSPVPTYRVRPHVLASTQGIAGAVIVRPQDLRRPPAGTHNRALAPVIQRTSSTVQPAASIAKPQPLGKNERGRLGSHPPRAAQGAVVVPGLTPAAKPQQPQARPPAQPASPQQQQAKPPSLSAPPQTKPPSISAPQQTKPQQQPTAPPPLAKPQQRPPGAAGTSQAADQHAASAVGTADRAAASGRAATSGQAAAAADGATARASATDRTCASGACADRAPGAAAASACRGAASAAATSRPSSCAWR